MDLKQIDVLEGSVHYTKYTDEEIIGVRDKKEKKGINIPDIFKRTAERFNNKKEKNKKGNDRK